MKDALQDRDEQVKQNNILKKLYKLEALVNECEDERMIGIWGKLQSVDHFSFIPGYHRSKGEIYQYINL